MCMFAMTHKTKHSIISSFQTVNLYQRRQILRYKNKYFASSKQLISKEIHLLYSRGIFRDFHKILRHLLQNYLKILKCLLDTTTFLKVYSFHWKFSYLHTDIFYKNVHIIISSRIVNQRTFLQKFQKTITRTFWRNVSTTMVKIPDYTIWCYL